MRPRLHVDGERQLIGLFADGHMHVGLVVASGLLNLNRLMITPAFPPPAMPDGFFRTGIVSRGKISQA
jgi:hypothetical protein